MKCKFTMGNHRLKLNNFWFKENLQIFYLANVNVVYHPFANFPRTCENLNLIRGGRDKVKFDFQVATQFS